MTEGDIRMELVQQDGDCFTVVDFGGPGAPLRTDRPPSPGASGADPARLLGAAVATDLAASLLSALRSDGNEPAPLRAEVAVSVERNMRGRLRIPRIAVDLHLGVAAASLRHAQRAVGAFEHDCVVTPGVRAGIDVQVRVWDAMGTALRADAS